MITRTSIQRYFLFLVTILLVACRPMGAQDVTPGTSTFTAEAVTLNPSPTFTPSANTPTLLPTFTPPVAFSTLHVTPTQTPQPTVTVAPTLTPLPAVLPKFPLDGYVMLFTKDGDLYFQEGEATPVKLTYIGEKAPSPILSDDNKKVVFFREEFGFSNIYSINADGSQEQTLVRNRAPLPINPNQNISQAFVPDTHLLLFNTYTCESQKEESLCAIGLSRVNTDTGEIKELVAPAKSDQHNLGGNFKVSPDGKMVSIAAIGHLELFSIEGKVIDRNILPYTPSTTYNLFPEQSWLPDSNGLIVGLPNTIYDSVAYGDLPAYTVWRYALNKNIAVQIPLEPSPMVDRYQISPDGAWILYGGIAEYESSLYIGNLTDGRTRSFDNGVYPHFSWSPNSEKFLFANKLGALDKPPATIGIINPLAWVDNTHFTYHELLVGIPDTDIQILVAEIKGETIFTYDLGISLLNLKVIKPK